MFATSGHAAVFNVTNLADSGTGSLRNAITQANGQSGSHTINFNLSGTINLGSALPTIESIIDINGAGQTIAIDGGGAHRVFSIGSGATAGNLTLQSLTVQNGFVGGDTSLGTRGSGESGAGALLFNGSLTVNGARFQGNTARNGGAIYAAGNLTNKLTIDNATFANNAAVDGFGGAIFVNGDDAANTGADLVIRNNTQIIDNRASVGGGVGVWSNANGSRTARITDSNIHSNDGGRAGGGIYATRNAQIEVNKSTVTQNQTTIWDGGGGYTSRGATIAFVDSVIRGNIAADVGGGVASFQGGNATFINSTLEQNRSTNQGGGVFITQDGKLTVTDSSVTDNQSLNNVGGGLYAEHRATIVDVLRSSITGNTSGSWGGGIYADSAKVSLIESLVADNTAAGNGGGIGMANADATLTVRNSTISGNHANAAQAFGGGVYLLSVAASFDSVTFADNIAGLIAANNDGSNGFGGAIGAAAITGQPASTVELLNSLFSNNWDRRMKDLAATALGITSLGYNLFEDDDPESHPDFNFGLLFSPESTDLLDALADLLALADNGGPTLTHALGLNSDAIDNGLTSLVVDQRSYLRPAGLADDIGAFEFGAVIPEPASLVLLGLGSALFLRRGRHASTTQTHRNDL